MNEFKAALLRLGDDAFFDLVRNYLGPIHTPFNKHDLIAKLESFLKHESTQERIIALVDDDDAALLSAIAILEAPSFDELAALFSQQHSYLDFHQRVVNLEDRLLVYRDGETLRLDPILEPLLRERVVRSDLLFPTIAIGSDEVATAPEQWFTDTLLVSLASWSYERPELYRADGTLRKRAKNDIEERFPSLTIEHRAEIAISALIATGALVNEERVRPVPHVWDSLASLGPARRTATLIASYATGEPASHATLTEAVEAIASLLPAGRAISPVTVERLLLVLAPDQDAEVARRAREALTLMGVLARYDEAYLRVVPISLEAQEPKPLVIQPNLDVMIPHEFAFEDALFIARIARLLRHDRYPHFVLTRERLADALRDGMKIDEIVDRLQTLTDSRVPQNVIVSLRGWAAEYESVRIFKGIALTLDPARRHSIEHESVRALIRRELAPGVYLVDEERLADLRSALSDAGIELLPELATDTSQPFPVVTARARALDRRRLASLASSFARSGANAKPSDPPSTEWQAEIQDRLSDADLTGEQREELAIRVRQKLIVSVDQIHPGSLKSEKTEARGLDYVGKVRIIEQAIRSGTSCVEVIERTDDGSPHRRLVEPHEMSRRGNELVLVGSELPARNEVELLVRKLGLVRRVRSGLLRRRPLGR